MSATTDQPSIEDLLATDYGWTPRQRQVLDFIVQGRSNEEIADTLGISLDGAKWHMREILSKLGVDTREEAAEYWRRYNGLRPRFARLFRGVTGAGATKWVAAGLAGIAVVGIAGLIAALAVGGGDDEPNAGDPDPTSTPGTVTTTATPTTSATAAVTPGPPTARVITLDTSPRPQPPEVTRVLAAAPASVFPDWDGVSTVIYDVQTGNAIDLGPGAQPAYFSPDETLAVFAAGDNFANGTEVFLVELPSGTTRSLGPGRMAVFQPDGTIMVILPGGNERVTVDPVTGERTTFTGDPNTATNAWPPSAPLGYRADPDGATSPAPVRTYTVKDDGGRVVLTFDGVAISAAGPHQVGAVAPPVDGRSNVYIIDLVTGEATYIATAIPGKDNYPFSANEDYVVWTDGYCSPDPGPVTLFDRRTGELVRLSGPDVDRWVHLTSTGLLASGAFGARYLIDPDTLDYVANIPSRPDGYGGDAQWSANHRFASHGRVGGHGGRCGP